MAHNVTYKFFICDLYTLKRDRHHQDLFQYGEHIVHDVDIMGIIRCVQHRKNTFYYDVDDGTGIITCWCINPEVKLDKMHQTVLKFVPQIQEEIQDQVEIIVDEIAAEEMLMKTCESGDLIRVRGVLKQYNGRRYIDSTFYTKVCGVDGPSRNAMSHHIQNQLDLYKNVYNQSPRI